MFQLPEMLWMTSPNYSSRGGQKVRLVVVHDCEGSEPGSIFWFAQARSRVSAHAVLSADGKRLTRMVEWGNKAWHACNFNPVSDGIEMAGFESKGFGSDEWQAMANVVAWRLKARGLPPRWAQAGQGDGVCSHRDLGQAGGGHSDPTTDPAVWGDFMKMVEATYGDAHGDAMPTTGWADTPEEAPAGWTPHGTVRHDHEVGSIEWLQLELNALMASGLAVDGLEGEKTEGALWRFQQAHGLVRDGILGPATIAAIAAASKVQQAHAG